MCITSQVTPTSHYFITHSDLSHKAYDAIILCVLPNVCIWNEDSKPKVINVGEFHEHCKYFNDAMQKILDNVKLMFIEVEEEDA